MIEKPEIYKTQPLEPKPGLSPVDRREVKSFYPPLAPRDQCKLEPFQF